MVVQFNEQLKADPLYEKLLQLIHSKIEDFPHNEVAFILMGLRKFQEPLCSPVLRDLFIHLQRNMDTLDMETLSYLSVGLRPRFYTLDNYRLVWRMAMAQSLPRTRFSANSQWRRICYIGRPPTCVVVRPQAFGAFHRQEAAT